MAEESDIKKYDIIVDLDDAGDHGGNDYDDDDEEDDGGDDEDDDDDVTVLTVDGLVAGVKSMEMSLMTFMALDVIVKEEEEEEVEDDDDDDVAHAAIDLKESYIGCYRNISSTKTVASVGSVDECSQECTDENNSMIALKDGEECNCIERLDSVVASSQCDVICDNDDACGGSDSYSVYKSKPRVMHDAFLSVDNHQPEDIVMILPAFSTLEMCAHFCFETNHTFFQTIKNGSCSCFQEHQVTLGYVQEQICEKCTYDLNEVCECYHKNYQDKTTIFSTRSQYDFQRGVSTYSHCRNRNNGSYEITEKCPEGCDPGWRGDSCRERDCSSGGGGCPNGMGCIESMVNDDDYVECVCPPGKVRNKWYQCEVYRKNIALHKPPYYSSIWPLETSHGLFLISPVYLTDGIHNGYFISHIFDSMPAWMAVDLLNLYCVGFIRAYGRLNAVLHIVGRMDRFVVRLNETLDTTSKNDLRTQTNLCGYGPEKAIQSGNPMVVLCEDFTIFSQFVIIQQSDERLHEGVTSLAELEVFEAGCDLLNGRCKNQTCVEVKNGDRRVISCVEVYSTTTANTNFSATAANRNFFATANASAYITYSTSSELFKIELNNLWFLLVLLVLPVIFAISFFNKKKKVADKAGELSSKYSGNNDLESATD
ncbi:hypothetical protein HELRODRAFT_183713 [Helobdella robusta]|uniref:WSC domain-containing protein n=1 Tax=Helobdella robusta TaxID=6412 RepID=T1FK35_HELRO|nr:hypothetical protein HELRODRAFT_183713 [Helobdella robusta]ESO10342.1 hypothetical protein HELRODRAFT_183713 [Helobdella robusta]